MGKAGQKPDQRPAMVHCYIFDGGQAESSKAGKIAFGIDEKRIDLRLKPRNDMCNDWRGTERLQKFVTGNAARLHPARLSSGDDCPCDFRPCDFWLASSHDGSTVVWLPVRVVVR